jgi:hypothetical protein
MLYAYLQVVGWEARLEAGGGLGRSKLGLVAKIWVCVDGNTNYLYILYKGGSLNMDKPVYLMTIRHAMSLENLVQSF